MNEPIFSKAYIERVTRAFNALGIITMSDEEASEMALNLINLANYLNKLRIKYKKGE